ncbi:carboxypeptidase-like regulatory domain-containing protein [Spirosoma sp. 209]|uniref:carboxypeptidase-like regulatory domain-containing protein n=1 Tax=Spirosoma sp. 209 TaxID=1955701 RepID=UPI00098D4BF9|nr:carboxypeptidase-like regulatory domain-containing protein [Spirosoma sp. 209]
MMKHAVYGLLVLLGLISTSTAGQTIRGAVLDQSSQQPIPFATLYWPATGQGTLSNENGDFELPAGPIPAQLIVSHVSFQTDTITVAAPADHQRIQLKPAVHQLAAVTVSNAGYVLIRQAVAKIQASQQLAYGKAFYRQLTRNGEQPTEIQEVIYNVKLSPVKVEGVQIANARYARLPSDAQKMYYHFSNFSYLILGQKAVSEGAPSAGRVLLPMRADVVDLYDVRVADVLIQPNGESIAELDCQVREGYANPAFSGKVFINMTTHDLVKLEGTIPNSLGAAMNTDKVQTRNFVYTLAVDYVKREGGNFMNAIRVGVTFEQLVKATGQTRTNRIQGFLLMNDLSNTATVARSAFKRVDIHVEDLKAIQRVTYNPAFWRANAAVRRTPLEENIINAFEQQGVMGTMTFDDL